MKATHYGECQLCGQQLKLPKGLSSKHTYSVHWTLYVGICPGSKQLPYEQSCELIKSRIPDIENEIEMLKRRKTDLLKPAKSSKCFKEVYVQGISVIVEGELIMENMEADNGYKRGQVFFVTEVDGKKIKKKISPIQKNLLDVATEINLDTANGDLRRRVERLQKYLEWCNERILKWELKKLKPVG